MKISALILDIGNVLIELDFSRLLKNLGIDSIGISIETLNNWPPYDAFERGLIEEHAFKEALEKLTGKTFEHSEFIKLWNTVFVGEVKGIYDVIKNVKIPLYALTNSTNPHIKFCLENFPVLKLFKKIFTSFEFHARKPEKEIYRLVTKWLKKEPDEILFIDDSETNLKGAKGCGIIVERCFNSATRLQEILKKYACMY